MITIDYYDILSEADLAQEEIESTAHPALSAAYDEEPYWQSFNKWMCFPAEAVQTYCAEIDYGQSYLPTFRVSDDKHHFYEFDLDPTPNLNCDETLSQWRELLENQRSFCVYAAYLQDLDDERELWVVDTIKSSRGLWSIRSNVGGDSTEGM